MNFGSDLTPEPRARREQGLDQIVELFRGEGTRRRDHDDQPRSVQRRDHCFHVQIVEPSVRGVAEGEVDRLAGLGAKLRLLSATLIRVSTESFHEVAPG